jgi:WD40 repeat protein
MTWPLSQDYNEAIQSPATSFADPELRAGTAATNALGIPMPRSGNFADVYEVRCPNGDRWAVKCFTRQVAGLRERYQEISTHLQEVRLPFAVDFQYLEQGIRVHGAWYPVLRMRWVEGLLLNEFVRDNLDKPGLLRALSQIWGRMARRLREAKLAHADLQHGNVILVPGSTANALAIKLIDYDGMFVPKLSGRKSGELGHANYQHPQRLQEGIYSLEVDRFPLLLVATALSAVAVGGRELWDRYDNGDNLLFKETDLRAPGQSPLFEELRRFSDPETRGLVGQLVHALGRPLTDCPLLEEPAPAQPVAARVAPSAVRTASRETASRSPAAAGAPGARRSGGQAGSAFDFDDDSAPVIRRSGDRSEGLPWVWIGVAGCVLALGLGAALLLFLVTGIGKGLGSGSSVAQAGPDDKKKREERPPPEPEPKEPGDGPKSPIVQGPTTPPEKPAPTPEKEQDPPPKQDDAVGEVRRFDGFGGAVRRVAWSADGKRLLAGCWDNTLYLFDMPGLKEPRELKAHTGGINDLVFLPGADKALSGGRDKIMRIWNLTEGSVRKELDGQDTVHAVAASADGRWAASSGYKKTVLVWDLEQEKVFRELSGHPVGVEGLAFTPKGDRLLTGDFQGTIRVWQVQNGSAERTLEGHKGHIFGLCVTPDGRYTLSAGQEGTLRLWSLRSGRELKRYQGHANAVLGLALSSDGRRLLSAGMDRSVRLWDVETGRELQRFDGHNSQVWTVAFSPDGRYAVSGGGDKTVRLWRLPPVDTPPDKPLDIPEPETEEKWPVPTGDVLAAAEANLRESFKAGLARKKPAEKKALAEEMLQRAGGGKEEPAGCYVLLREAADQAAQVLELDLALRAVDEMDRRFRVNALEMKAGVLEQAGKAAALSKANGAVGDTALLLVDAAIAADDYESAGRLVQVARAAGEAIRDVVLQNRAQDDKKRLEVIRKEYEGAQAAEKVLAGQADDPAANLTVGRFHALVKEDWGRGLPYLARGADEKLRALAARDLGNPPEVADRVAVADGWWDQAETASAEVKVALQRRALFWYRQALGKEIAGIDRARVEGRVKALEKAPGVRGPWDHLDLSDVQMRGSFVRIPGSDAKKSCYLTARESYSGSVEITVVARTEAGNIRLVGPRGSALAFNPKGNQRELHVWRPDGNEREESGTDVWGLMPRPLASRTWYTLRWKITSKGMEVTVNGARVFAEVRSYDLSFRHPLRVGGGDSVVDVRSFVVRQLP